MNTKSIPPSINIPLLRYLSKHKCHRVRTHYLEKNNDNHILCSVYLWSCTLDRFNSWHSDVDVDGDGDEDVDVDMDMAMKRVEHLKWHKAIRGHHTPRSPSGWPTLSHRSSFSPGCWWPSSWSKFFHRLFHRPGKWFYTHVTSPACMYVHIWVQLRHARSTVPQCPQCHSARHVRPHITMAKSACFYYKLQLWKILYMAASLSSRRRIVSHSRDLLPVTCMLRQKKRSGQTVAGH